MELTIFSDSKYLDNDGNMHINGSLENLGNVKLVNAKIVATYYDASSNVVAEGSINFDPELTGEINPGQTVSFEVVLGSERAQYVATYALAAESNQYASITEFPLGFLPSCLFLSLTATVIIMKRMSARHAHM
jgi:hypothetical protein